MEEYRGKPRSFAGFSLPLRGNKKRGGIAASPQGKKQQMVGGGLAQVGCK